MNRQRLHNTSSLGPLWWKHRASRYESIFYMQLALIYSCSHNCSTAKKPGLAVYGADARIPEINYVCKDQEEFKLGNLQVTPLHTPCHTKGHVCYSVVDPGTGEKAVFTGEYVPFLSVFVLQSHCERLT